MNFVVVTETGDTPANRVIDNAFSEKKDHRVARGDLEAALRVTGNIPLEVISRIDDPRLREYRHAGYRVFELRDGYLHQETAILDMIFPLP